MGYEMMKVFDCQDMPEDVQEVFFKTCGSPSFTGGNDCAVKDWVEKPGTYEPDRGKYHEWLVANGAEYGETVIILYWW